MKTAVLALDLVDVYLRHHFDSVRIDDGRLRARACDLGARTENLSREPFGYLAARGVRDAEKQDSRRHGYVARPVSRSGPLLC
jgi:hypothetical protein